ncbi:hypothetical protein L9F63_018570, partial [Diploptera punctata]
YYLNLLRYGAGCVPSIYQNIQEYGRWICSQWARGPSVGSPGGSRCRVERPAGRDVSGNRSSYKNAE